MNTCKFNNVLCSNLIGYSFGSIMPGRNYQSSSSYRYGMNGQEKDDEIAGSGNIYTAEYWEYDSRTGRRWNIDPVVKPWESSYACFNNNPVLHNDVNGDDSGVSTKKDKDGKITNIKVSAKIFIQGPGANEKRAEQLTKAATEVYKTKVVDGVEVSFDVKYEYAPDKKQDDLIAKNGENILNFSDKGEPSRGAGRSHVNGYTYGAPYGPDEYTGNTGTINNKGKDDYTVLHESLHLVGLSDRYNPYGANPGYEKDIMGARNQMTLKTSHYQNIIEYTKLQHKVLNVKAPKLTYFYNKTMMDLKYPNGKRTLKR